MSDSNQHSELHERIASIRDTPNSKDAPWSEFIEFAGKLDQDIGPLFGRDAALVAQYARSLEEQLESAQKALADAVWDGQRQGFQALREAISGRFPAPLVDDIFEEAEIAAERERQGEDEERW